MAKSKKKPSKKKPSKKKPAKKKGSRKPKKNPSPRGAAGGSSGAMAKAMKGYARPKTMKGIVDKWSRVRERTAALQCKDMATCGWYIDALLDALDTAMGAWTQFGTNIKLQKKEIRQLESALEKTEGQLKTAKAKLKATKTLPAADRKGIQGVLDALTKEVKALRTDVRRVAKGRQMKLPARKAVVAKRISRPKRAPRGRQLALPRTPGGHAAYTAASGAGCSLAAVRWGYKGPEDCAPKGYKPSVAGRRLANVRWHGVAFNPGAPAAAPNPCSAATPVSNPPQFNPSEYYEMGYEDGRASKASGPKKKAPKKKAPKRNPTPPRGRPTSSASSTSARAAAARTNRMLSRL